MMPLTMTNSAVPPSPKPTRLQMGLWLAIMLLTLALSLYDWDGYRVGTYGDDASYVTNADSLLQRVPYGTLLTPGQDRVTQFPFLLPLVLAPFRVLFPLSLDAMRAVPLVATLLALSVLFWGWGWIGRGVSYGWGIVVLALTALSPVTILHARTIMSEAPFLVLTLLMVIWVEKIVRQTPKGWGIGFGILLVLLMYTRSIGWLFGGVWIAYLFWKCGRGILPQLGLALLSGLLLLGVVLATTTVRPVDLLPQEYVAQLANTLDNTRDSRTPANPKPGTSNADPTASGAVPTPSAGLITPGGTQLPFPQATVRAFFIHLDFADKLPYGMERAVIDWTDSHNLLFLRYLPSIAALVLLCVGAVAWWRRTGLTAFQIIVPPYLAFLSIWSWNGARLFYPVQAEMILAFVLGLGVSAQWLATRVNAPMLWRGFAPAVVGAFAVVLLAGCIWLDLNFTRTMLLPGDPAARAAQLTATIPEGAIVMSTRATTDHLYVPRPMIDIPIRNVTPQTLSDYIRQQNITFIASPNGLLATQENARLRIGSVERFTVNLQPLVKAGALELVFEDAPNDFVIYQVKTERLSAFLP